MHKAPTCVVRLVLIMMQASVIASAAFAVGRHETSMAMADVSTTLLHPSSATSLPPSGVGALLRHLGEHIQYRSGIAGWASVLGGDHVPRPSAPCPVAAGGTVASVLQLRLDDDGGAGAVSRGRMRPRPAGSFSLAVHARGSPCNGTWRIVIAASDHAGLRGGLGRLARELRVYRAARVEVPAGLAVEQDGSATLWPLRGHQYTSQHHPSMFRTWDMFDAFTHDNAVFGTNPGLIKIMLG